MHKPIHVRLILRSLIIFLAITVVLPGMVFATDNPDEAIYRKLLNLAAEKDETSLFARLNHQARHIGWEGSDEIQFTGNLRIINSLHEDGSGTDNRIYLLRKLTGQLFILSVPANPSARKKDADSPYAGLDDISGSKMIFKVNTLRATIDNETYPFAHFVSRPEQMQLDRIFKISIILMLFFVMVGMGMTLTFKEFALVFVKPRGIILGELLQFGVMPFLAMCLGHLLGFYEQYPFIFVGMILITAIPGGVTSNLMTYYAKGDLALSISLTSFSTVLSIVFTPLMLSLYCANMPEVTIPLK